MMKIVVPEDIFNKWGVYKITNLITKNFYIGSTTENFAKRLSKHKSDFKRWKSKEKKRSTCPRLYNAFLIYGIKNFEFSVIRYLVNKKDSNTNERVATFLEERYINLLSPKYNICKKPSRGGCPNSGRKLTDEWKKRIGEKSKLYRHSNNLEVYNKKAQQNKDLSCKYKISKGEFTFIGTAFECRRIKGCSNFWRWLNKECSSRDGWKVEKISTQMKKIRIYNEKESIEFNSFGKCDRFLKMWRGFTSTQVVNNKNVILDYKYEIL